MFGCLGCCLAVGRRCGMDATAAAGSFPALLHLPGYHQASAAAVSGQQGARRAKEADVRCVGYQSGRPGAGQYTASLQTGALQSPPVRTYVWPDWPQTGLQTGLFFPTYRPLGPSVAGAKAHPPAGQAPAAPALGRQSCAAAPPPRPEGSKGCRAGHVMREACVVRLRQHVTSCQIWCAAGVPSCI